MAGGGFASNAMNVVKMNRALLKKRKIRSRTDLLEYTSKTIIKDRITTPGQMRAVKLQAAANRKRNFIIWIIAIGATLLVLGGIYLWVAE